MHTFIQIISLFFCCYSVYCTQPYFPSQVVFTVDNTEAFYAIDEVNQRAYASVKTDFPQAGYVFQHFPYAPTDTPQAKYYVELVTRLDSNLCEYGTYWTYNRNPNSIFPSHWQNTTSFQIKNYVDSNYKMIHSKNDSKEDYWYSNETCYDEFENDFPCFRVYFKKNTNIPLRSIALGIVAHRPLFLTTEYQILSVGKPDDKYFANISKNWYSTCLDANLGVKYSESDFRISYHHYKTIEVSLFSPPHRINGNDTVIIQWNVTDGCDYCLTWTPKQLVFNGQNFNQIQNLTLYREFDSDTIILTPSFIGGGFDLVSPSLYAITSEGA